MEILSNIHLQSNKTLINNDSMWKDICGEIKIIKYKPTDRNSHDIDY